MTDIVEYYNGNRCFLRLQSSIVPLKDQIINIKKRNFKVNFVSYAIDYSSTPKEEIVACVSLEEQIIAEDMGPDTEHYPRENGDD